MATSADDARAATAGEAELAERFAAGERVTYALVSHWIMQVIMLPIWRFTEESEDVASVVVLKLLANLRARRFRGESTFRTYVQRIARYTCIDQVRAQRAQRQIQPEEIPQPAPPETPEQIRLQQEKREVFIKIFKAIGPECQRLWRMVFSECLTYKQIGERFKVPEGSVKRKVHECKKAAIELREKLI
jgi:RNA polymerase sigma factor (sigma-70 family)